MDISESCLDGEHTVTMIEDIVETDETVVNQPRQAHSPEECAPEDCMPEDCAREPKNLPPLTQSKKVEDNTEVFIKKMQSALNKLTTLDGLEEFFAPLCYRHICYKNYHCYTVVAKFCNFDSNK